MLYNNYKNSPAYKTKDGSSIRELMHPNNNSCENQSLAEAVVEPNEMTQAHYHTKSEELYYILLGEGQLRINDEWRMVAKGDVICINPGDIHQIKNTSKKSLVFLCCCSPAYSHEDTILC